MHREGGGLGRHPDPEPGLLAGLSPAGLVDVDHVGPADGPEDLGHRVGQGLAGLTLQLGDQAGGDLDAQQVGVDPLDLPPAQPMGPAEQAGPGLESRTEGPARDVAGELGPVGGPAPRAGQAVGAVFDDLGSDLGEFGDLMAKGPGSWPSRAWPQPVQEWGLISTGPANCSAGTSSRVRRSWPNWPPPPPIPGGEPGRLPFDVERLGR